MAMQFKPAERKASYFRLGLIGASGSGKTWSALEFARGLVGPKGRIAVIDTENGSASLYQGNVAVESQPQGFDVLELGRPWSVPRYVEAINLAVSSGYQAVIIDQISWLWEGDGGILELVDKLAKGKKDSFSAWKEATPVYWDFVRAILSAPIHVITNIRAKPHYEVTKNAEGRAKIQKLGMKPIQREGFDFELTTIFSLDSGHCAEVDKDRTGLFGNRPSVPLTRADGEAVAEWLHSGKPADPAATLALMPPGTGARAAVSPEVATRAEVPEGPKVTIEQRKALVELGTGLKLSKEKILEAASEVVGFKLASTSEIPAEKFGDVCLALEAAAQQ